MESQVHNLFKGRKILNEPNSIQLENKIISIFSAEECANCILQMIESAENGAIWLFRDSKIEKVVFSSASHEQRN